MSEYATRDDLLGKPLARRFKVVEVCGKKFRLRSLTAGEANGVAARHMAAEDEESRAKALATLSCRYVVLCVVDADGNRILSDLDVAKLMDSDSAFIEALAKECQSHAGVDTTVEDAEKNSETTTG